MNFCMISAPCRSRDFPGKRFQRRLPPNEVIFKEKHHNFAIIKQLRALASDAGDKARDAMINIT